VPGARSRGGDGVTAPMPYFGNLPRFTEPALCAETDPDVWFPEKGGSAAKAKATCRACPARDECLAYALEHDIGFGVWAGKTPEERRKLRQRSGRSQAPVVHGTEAGYKAHYRRKEQPCGDCREASRAARLRRGYRGAA